MPLREDEERDNAELFDELQMEELEDRVGEPLIIELDICKSKETEDLFRSLS